MSGFVRCGVLLAIMLTPVKMMESETPSEGRFHAIFGAIGCLIFAIDLPAKKERP
jgi:hypothetical protein